jgi:hypothetical protein
VSYFVTNNELFAAGYYYNKIEMTSTFAALIKDLKPKERRPYMALVTLHFTKAEAETYIDSKITHREWTRARLHCKYPGPLQPVEVLKISRRRYDEKAVANFLGFLSENFLQDHAFGDKNAKLSNGAIVQLDAVSATANSAHIIREYAKAFCPEALQQRAGGCPKQDKRTRCYCRKDENHEGSCMFTDKSMLSATSIDTIVSTLTNGRLQSRAGLDDEDVVKGSRNIERLVEIYDDLAATLNHSQMKREETQKRIEWIITYHRTGFVSHLTEHGKKCCQCLSCGLHSDKDPVPCCFRHDDEDSADGECHDGPCNDCEQVFGILSELLQLTRDATNLFPVDTMPQERERFEVLESELEQRWENLIHWRSHIARKSVESKFSRKQLQSLKPNQAIVTSDWKMKIQALLRKETKQEFFAKRGTSCLGFMIATNVEGKEGEIDVTFSLFFTDDTQQDAFAIIAAKHYVYSEILPQLFPSGTEIEVFFESDGAGAYNCHAMKGVMPYWKQWTGVEEIQIRVSVSGDGKSPLDGLFGCLSQGFRAAVDNGIVDIRDAHSCVMACQEGAGIVGASTAVLELDREFDMNIDIGTKIPRLLESHRIVLDRENNQMVTYTNSGYGGGQNISFDRIKRMFTKPPREPLCYTMISKADGRGTAHHSSELHQLRQEKIKQTKREAANNALEAKHHSEVAKARAKSLYKCPEVEGLTKSRCQCEFSSQAKLDKHIKEGSHNFPSRNLIDHSIARSAMEGGVLQIGSNPQRSQAYANMEVTDGKSKVLDSDTHFQPGCYRKPPRKKAERFHPVLRRFLDEMFDEGESTSGGPKNGKNKWTPLQAWRILKDKRLDDGNGPLMFKKGSTYGPCPNELQIKSYWSRLKSKRNKQSANDRDDQDEEDEEAEDDHGGGGETTQEVVCQTDSRVTPEDPLPSNKQTKKSSRKRKQADAIIKKKFVVDGDFTDVDAVMVLIEKELGGLIQGNLTKNVGEYHISDKFVQIMFLSLHDLVVSF